MIAILGDLHFRDDQKYWRDTCTAFLNWFKDWELNNENNSLILAGDLVETPVLSGTVVDYLEKFVEYSKFKGIHICVGNHDKKKINGRDQIAYEFYKNKKSVFIYEEATETIIDGKKVLILPYYLGTNFDNQSMHDYYSNIYKNKHFKNDYDLVVGHFCGEDCIFPGNIDYAENLDKINTKHLILGHIHTRYNNPTRYIGSVFANKKSENDYTRSAIIIKDDNSRYEYSLPLFNEFLAVTYPCTLPDTQAIVPIYTVLNCASEAVAFIKYGDIAIKRVTPDKVEQIPKRKTTLDRQFNMIKELDVTTLFKSFCKEQNPKIPFDIEQECLNMLGVAN